MIPGQLTIKKGKPRRDVFRLPKGEEKLRIYNHDVASLKAQCRYIADLQGEIDEEDWKERLLKLQTALSILKY